MQRTIATESIGPRPGNRDAGGFDLHKLHELSASIADQGILQPLLVRRAGERYELVAGERRLRAAKLAGLTEVPVNVMGEDTTDTGAELASLIENIQREDIHPLDEGAAYDRLRSLGMNVAQITAKAGRSRNHVDGRLRLLNLIPEIQTAWAQTKMMQVGVADEIARLPAVHQTRFWKKAQRDKRLLGPGPERRYWIDSSTDELDKAPFDRSDSTLVPNAGACTECPKRFGFQQSLGLMDDGDEPGQRCGDRPCWKRKLKAHVDLSRTTLETAETPYVETGGGKDQLKPWEWSEIRVDPDDPRPGVQDPDPQRPVETFLHVDGPEAGRVVQGQRTEMALRRAAGEDVDVYQPRDWEAERREAERKTAAHVATRLPLWRMLAEHIATRSAEHLQGDLLHRPILEIVASSAMSNSRGTSAAKAILGYERDPDHAWHEDANAFAAYMEKLVDEQGTAPLLKLILLSLVAHHVDRTDNQGNLDDEQFDLLTHLLDRAGLPWQNLEPDPLPDPDADEDAEVDDAG